MKRILTLVAMMPLSGCTMLGTYMDPLNPAPSYSVNHQIKHIRFVNISPSWLVNHNTIQVYRVGPYDVLNVIVWDHPELTATSTSVSPVSEVTGVSGAGDSGFLVSAQGNITFPFANTLHVAGLTIPQVEKKIEHGISNYIRNPQVNVRVTVFRSQEAQILGEVGGQRTIALSDKPISLLDALNQAGGTNVMTSNTSRIYVIRGDVTNITVFRLNAKSPQMMVAAQHFNIKNNDIIYVSPLSVTNWDRIFSQVLPFLGSAAAVKATTGKF